MYDEFSHSEKQVLNKLARFCSYRDRSEGEVKQKMKALGVSKEKYPKFISCLTDEKFLDEERFCRIYVRSKLLQNHWGRQKIYSGLKSKFVANHNIENALNTLDIEEYNSILSDVLQRKSKELESEDSSIKKQKIIRYALSKGFTYGEILELLK